MSIPHGLRSTTFRRIYNMTISIVLAGATLAMDQNALCQTAPTEPRWVGTWFAASTARSDQPASPVSAAPAPANPQPTGLPPAVLAVATSKSSRPADNHRYTSIIKPSAKSSTSRSAATASASSSRTPSAPRRSTSAPPTSRSATRRRHRPQLEPASNLQRPTHRHHPARPATRQRSRRSRRPCRGRPRASIVYLPDDTRAANSPLTIHPAAWQTNYVSPPGNYAGERTCPSKLQPPIAAPTDSSPPPGSFSRAWKCFRPNRLRPSSPSATPSPTARLRRSTRTTAGPTISPAASPPRRCRSPFSTPASAAIASWPRAMAPARSPALSATSSRNRASRTSSCWRASTTSARHARIAAPTAQDLIAAHRQLINRAHARGLKIYGATLLPFEGADYWTAPGEAKRKRLNEWIRTSRAYDAVRRLRSRRPRPGPPHETPPRIRPRRPPPPQRRRLPGAGRLDRPRPV